MTLASSRVDDSFAEEVIATVPEGIISIDEGGTIVFATPKIEGLLGYAPEELVDRSIERLAPSTGGETTVFDAIRRRADTGKDPPGYDTAELRLAHGNGHDVSVAITAERISHDDRRFFTAIIRDVSEPGGRERALEEAETRFRKTFEYATDPLMIVDPREDAIRECNAAACELLGYSQEELLALGPSDVHPGDVEAFREFVETVFEEGESWTDELRCRTAAGDTVPAEVAGVMLELDGRRHMLLRVRDITERRERERRHRESMELFQKAFECSNDAILVIDPEADGIEDANPRASELLGYDHEELLSMGPSDIHPHELDRFREFIERVFEEGAGWTDELSCYTCDEELIPTEISMSRLDLDGDPHVLASVRDISERREREEELDQYERLVETIGDGVYTLDENLRFTTVNQGMAELTGYSKAELTGMHLGELLVGEVDGRGREYGHLLGEDRRAVVDLESGRAARRELRQSDREIMRVDCPIVSADGGVVPCEVRFSALPTDGDEDFVGTAGVFMDISDRLEWEQRLREEHDRLSTLFENATDPIVEVSFEGETPIIESVNPAFEETFGYGTTEVSDRSVSDVLVPGEPGEDSTHETIAHRVLGEERIETEVERRTAHGTRAFWVRVIPFSTADGVRGCYAIYTDITERKEHKRRLEELHTATRTLMGADTAEAAGSIAVETAADILDLSRTGLHLLDDDGGLVPAAWTDDLERSLGGEPPTFEPGQGLAWDVFETGEATYRPDLQDANGVYDPETRLRSELQIPLGDHGVLLIASTTPDAFDETQLELAHILAAKTEAALDRIEYERQLEALSEASRELLVAEDEAALASTTVEIVQRVFDRSLVAMWSYDADEGTLVPIGATDEARAVDATDAPAVGPIPSGTAEMEVFHDGEPTLVEDYGALDDAAHPENPLRTLLLFPLGSHGLFNVGFPAATAVDPSERELLEILARNVQAAFDRLDREREIRRRSTAMEASIDGMGILDEADEYVYVNQAHADIYGYDAPEDLLGESWKRLYGEAETERFETEIMPTVREQGHWWGEAVGKRADGTTFPQELSLAALEDGGLSCVVRDITERREYQRRLEESNERLEQFAYAASHDLQEPLRMVSSYLSLIDRRYGEELDDEAREFLEFAVDGADRMREMIKGLLQYSRVETEGDSLEPVDLEAVFEDARKDLEVRIEESDAAVTAESLPEVRGDASQLRQVFGNLLDNAIEYSGEAPPRVRVDAERAGEEWILSVRDEGIGIDPDDTDRIFEVFQRAHTEDDHDGTGIGLALCRQIVERHGGEIWVDAEPGEGSTFSFRLPATGRDD